MYLLIYDSLSEFFVIVLNIIVFIEKPCAYMNAEENKIK